MSENKKINLLYISPQFPHRMENNKTREVVEIVRNKNLNLKIISFRDASEDVFLPDRVKSAIWYPKLDPVQIGVANFIQFFKNSNKYLSLIGFVIFGRYSKSFLKIKDLGAMFVGISLAEKIRGMNIDHIHAISAIGSTTAALAISKLLDIPFTFSSHMQDVHTKQMMIEKKISLAKAVITCTKFSRDYLISLVPLSDKKKIVCVYLGRSVRVVNLRPTNKTSSIFFGSPFRCT